MNLVAINGSPKPKNSASGMLINYLEDMLRTKATVYHAAQLIRQGDAHDALTSICKADVLLIVFPLYIDSLPAPLIKTLTMIETASKAASLPLPKVYALCNCGFYEGTHNALALSMIESFAARCGMTWGYGVGIGSGGMILSQKKLCQWPTANAHAALVDLAEAIKNDRCGLKNVFITPKMPRWIYLIAGNFIWNRMAKTHGVKKEIRATPHLKPRG
jgi:uncharacterized protein (UPF0254 family)